MEFMRSDELTPDGRVSSAVYPEATQTGLVEAIVVLLVVALAEVVGTGTEALVALVVALVILVALVVPLTALVVVLVGVELTVLVVRVDVSVLSLIHI